MRKVALLLVFVVNVTLQHDGNSAGEENDEGTKASDAKPRMFVGKAVEFQENSSRQQRPFFKHTRNESQTQDPSWQSVADSRKILLLQNNSTGRYLDGTLSTKVIPAIYLLVVTIGIPANVAILCMLVTKVRKVSSAILYCSLAISDLLLLFSLLFKAHYHLHGNHWLLGETACRLVTACFYGNLYCSAQTLACISVKRYLAVVHPFMYKSLPKKAYTACVGLTVWVVFGAAVVPELFIQQTFMVSDLNRITCHDVLPGDDSLQFLLYYHLLLTLFGLLVPLVVTVLCYTRILLELHRSNLDWAIYIKASSLVFAIFLLCFTPAGVLRFIHFVQLCVDRTESLYVCFNVAVCLCCLHACLDPFLFLLLSKSAGSSLRYSPSKSLSISI